MRSDDSSIDQYFYGSATIGERGQVVIPADARKECGFNSGDKLLVFRHPMHPNVLILARVAEMQQLHQQMQQAMERLNRKIAAEAEAETDIEEREW